MREAPLYVREYYDLDYWAQLIQYLAHRAMMSEEFGKAYRIVTQDPVIEVLLRDLTNHIDRLEMYDGR